MFGWTRKLMFRWNPSFHVSLSDGFHSIKVGMSLLDGMCTPQGTRESAAPGEGRLHFPCQGQICGSNPFARFSTFFLVLHKQYYPSRVIIKKGLPNMLGIFTFCPPCFNLCYCISHFWMSHELYANLSKKSKISILISLTLWPSPWYFFVFFGNKYFIQYNEIGKQHHVLCGVRAKHTLIY